MWTISNAHSDSDSAFHYWQLPDREGTTLNYPIVVKDGEPGTPLPYNVQYDDTLTLMLLISLVVVIMAVARSSQILSRQAKTFFRSNHGDSSETPTTYPAVLVLLVAVDCLMLGFTAHNYAVERITPAFAIESHALVTALFSILFLAYFAVKWMLYGVVNGIFFGSKKRLQWNHAFLFITALEGLLLLPLVFLLAYFDLSMGKAVIYYSVILFLNKLLTFYKCWAIFFKQNKRYMQIFLYFCALEAAPLIAFLGVWLALVNLLKVIF